MLHNHYIRKPKLLAESAPKAVVTEAPSSSILGAWVLPVGGAEGYVLLPINADYGRGAVDMVKPGDPLLAGYNAIHDRFPWMEKAMQDVVHKFGNKFFNDPDSMNKARAVVTVHALQAGCAILSNDRVVIMDVIKPPQFISQIVSDMTDGQLAKYEVQKSDKVKVVDIKGRVYNQSSGGVATPGDPKSLLALAAAVKGGNLSQLTKLIAVWEKFHASSDTRVKAFVSRELDSRAQRAIAALRYLTRCRSGAETPEASKMEKILQTVEDWGGMDLVEAVYDEFGEFETFLVPPDSPYELSERRMLTEVSFNRLMSLTTRNGRYRNGGLINIGGMWVTDTSVPGRRENARFIITRPPQVVRDEDGLLTIRFHFQSRRNRNTTGVAHVGYIKFTAAKGMLKKILRKIKRVFLPHQYDQDVLVKCSCPDFKYRFHKVLADMGAAERPTGVGSDPIDAPPIRTNPNNLPSLCKHLVALAPFLQMSDRQFSDVGDLTQTTPQGPSEPRAVKPGADTTEIPDEK